MDQRLEEARANERQVQEVVEKLVNDFQDAARRLNDWEMTCVVSSGQISTAPNVIFASRVPTLNEIGTAIEEWRQARVEIEKLEMMQLPG